MSEFEEVPAIVAYGFQYIDTYSVQEYRDMLKRAFKDKRADYIVLDSNPRGQKFLAAGVAWAIREGLLYNDLNTDDTQQIVSSFRLTQKGKEELGEEIFRGGIII